METKVDSMEQFILDNWNEPTNRLGAERYYLEALLIGSKYSYVGKGLIYT